MQGVGGDAKASVLAKNGKDWKQGTWADVEEAGFIVSKAIIEALNSELVEVEPNLFAHSITMNLQLKTPLTRAEYKRILETERTLEGREDVSIDKWVEDMIEHIDRGFELPSTVPITIHALQIGDGVRMVSLEGEAVAEFGHIIEKFFEGGVTFPVSYTDGCQMYLPTTKMLTEVGYEVDSSWEYRKPTPLFGGHEKVLLGMLNKFYELGIK